jgi:tetratricopeptide (TPR) repeat protein
VLVLTSFPPGDRVHEWWKERLRWKFGVHAPRWSKERAELVSAVLREQDGSRWDEAFALLAGKEELVSGDAFLSYLLGESAAGKGDHATAEKGYRRALALHESREDVLDPILVWPVLDGFGAALVLQKKLDESSKVLTRAADLARAGKPEGWTQSLYNLACCEALRKRWGPALAALKEAIDAEPSWKSKARGDSDLAEALKRPEFAKLVAE